MAAADSTALFKQPWGNLIFHFLLISLFLLEDAEIQN